MIETSLSCFEFLLRIELEIEILPLCADSKHNARHLAKIWRARNGFQGLDAKNLSAG